MTALHDLKVVVDPDNMTIDIRQSAIQAFLDCRRKFRWEYVVGIEKDYLNTERPWTTADIGTAVHAGVGAYYAGENWETALVEWADENFPDPEPKSKADKGLRLAGIMTAGHIRDVEADGADIGEQTVEVEFPVMAEFQIRGWTVRVHGRIDRLVYSEDLEVLILEDTKTTDKLASALDHIQQLGRYAVILHMMGYPVRRVRINQIKKVLRQGDGPFYHRPYVPLNGAALNRHADNLEDTLTDIVRVIENDGPWYEHVTGECDWKCRVQDICLAQQHGDDPETIVNLYYKDKVLA